MAEQLAVQIEITSADATQPDPATVSDFADEALADLRSLGMEAQPVYTGAMGGDVYEILKQVGEGIAANKEIILALITGVVAPIAGALAKRLETRADKKAAAKPTAPESNAVVVVVEQVQVTITEPEITPDDLLRRLLAADPHLPQRVSTSTRTSVRVMVPPRPSR